MVESGDQEHQPAGDALAGAMALLTSEVAALRRELADLRLALGALSDRLSPQNPVPELAQPAGLSGAGLTAQPITTVSAPLPNAISRAATLQARLRQGLSQGIDPAEDVALDLLIDQMHDLAGDL